MSTNQELREEIILNAETAFFDLMHQIDYLFNCIQFWFERYHADDESTRFKIAELDITCENIAAASTQLADHISRWKKAEKPLMSSLNVEILVLNELWANVQALVYFLASHEICLEHFEGKKMFQVLINLIRANRIL